MNSLEVKHHATSTQIKEQSIITRTPEVPACPLLLIPLTGNHCLEFHHHRLILLVLKFNLNRIP